MIAVVFRGRIKLRLSIGGHHAGQERYRAGIENCPEATGVLRTVSNQRCPWELLGVLSWLQIAGVAPVKLPPRSSQSERLRGAVCTDDQGIVFGADDLVRGEGGAESDC